VILDHEQYVAVDESKTSFLPSLWHRNNFEVENLWFAMQKWLIVVLLSLRAMDHGKNLAFSMATLGVSTAPFQTTQSDSRGPMV
jgi:hypothetical protein